MAELVVELSDGVRIVGRDNGGHRPVVVLLHALGEDENCWDGIEPFLTDRFRVITVSLRGHGASSRPGRYSLESMRDDVLGVLDHLGLERVLLVGHSLGGVVAYLLAQEHPTRLTGLVVEDAAPPFARTRATPARPAGELGFDWAAVEQVHEQLNDPTMRWWKGLTHITCPTLLVGGGETSPLPQHRLREAAELIPDCTLVTIDVGHDVHEAQPQVFARAVLGWLDRPLPPGRT